MKNLFARGDKCAVDPLLPKQLLDEADLCVSHASEAAGCGRYCAACGLILTADALCRRALSTSSEPCEAVLIEQAVASRLGFYQDEIERLVERAVQHRLVQHRLSEAQPPSAGVPIERCDAEIKTDV